MTTLPQDLSAMTAAEHSSAIAYLAKKPLRELRKRQDLISKQIEKAHALGNDRALSNLQIKQQHTDAAVDKRTFG